MFPGGAMTTAVSMMQLPGRLTLFVVATMLWKGLCRSSGRESSLSRNGLWPRHKNNNGVEEIRVPHLRSNGSSNNDNSNKVSVQVSMESLCIDSKNYMLEQVVPTFLHSPLGGDDGVMELEIVMFGNAHLHAATQTVTCQHGAAECDANVWESCAIDNFVYPTRYVPFLACLFGGDGVDGLPMGRSDTPYDAAVFARCARRTALDFAALQRCHDEDGWAVQVQAAAQTPAAHDHVPWLVVDGRHVQDQGLPLAQVVCQALQRKGGSHKFCNQLVLSSLQ